MSKIREFLKELDTISRKYGIWIEVDENADGIALVNEDLDVIAVGLYCDDDTQEYLVQEVISE
jgi:hypothetical protein